VWHNHESAQQIGGDPYVNDRGLDNDGLTLVLEFSHLSVASFVSSVGVPDGSWLQAHLLFESP